MQARFIDPVLEDTSNEPEQAFAEFMKKVERSHIFIPIPEAASSTYVSYEPLERSFVTRLAVKLVHCLARGEQLACTDEQSGPNNLDQDAFDVPQALLQACDDILTERYC